MGDAKGNPHPPVPRSIGVVFVNYRCADGIRARVPPLVDEGWHTVVVDNSGEYQGPGDIVRPGSNVGFGAACNIGVSSLPVDVRAVCFHNPDVDTSAADLLRLHEALARLERPGAVAPSLRTPTGLVVGGYHEPQLIREFGMVLERTVTARRGSAARRNHQSARRPLSTPGPRFGSAALLLVSRAAFESVNGFDERFPLYGEDLDLWRRMATSGQEMRFEPAVEVFHRQSAGSPTSASTREILRMAGIELFVQLHHGRRWRLYRRLHRAATADGLGQETGPAGELVMQGWAAGVPPLVVARSLSSAFADGIMETP